MTDQYRFKVNLGGMIDILSNHLYSSPNVFVRELLQNGVDAIKARQNYQPGWNTGKIEISLIDDQTIELQDNGIGLTQNEIHQFLSIIGESSKRDLQKGVANEDYIGRFGIGLLSCFMVSKDIHVMTKSVKNNETWQWIGKPDGTYSLTQLSIECDYGTKIILRCKEGYEHFYTNEKLIDLINYYGGALPVPIYLKENNELNHLNKDKVIWDKRLNSEEILAYGEKIFEERFIDYIPISSPSGQVNGVAFIISHKVASTAKNNHRIYLKNMLLTEKNQEILPEWAFFIKCILNTNGLRPTASREGFYEDELLLKTKEEIGDCIINYFIQLEKRNPNQLSHIVSIHDLALKSLALENDTLYRIFFNYFQFETSLGMLTGKEIMNFQVVPYTNSVDKFRQIAPLFSSQNKLLVNCGYVYLQELFELLPELVPQLFIDFVDSIDLIQVMDELSYEETEHTFSFLQHANRILARFNCKVAIKRYNPIDLPAIYLINEEAMYYKDILKIKENEENPFNDLLDGFIDEFNEEAYSELCLNYDNSLVQQLLLLDDLDALTHTIELIYVQSLLLGHYPLGSEELKSLNNGIISIIEWGVNKCRVN